jgi:hypothetical protein
MRLWLFQEPQMGKSIVLPLIKSTGQIKFDQKLYLSFFKKTTWTAQSGYEAEENGDSWCTFGKFSFLGWSRHSAQINIFLPWLL